MVTCPDVLFSVQSSNEKYGEPKKTTYVVVVDQDLDVEVLRDGEASGLGVVSLLLCAVRAEAEDGLGRFGESNAVHERPHVSKPARREFDAGREAESAKVESSASRTWETPADMGNTGEGARGGARGSRRGWGGRKVGNLVEYTYSGWPGSRELAVR